jgi:hypothetical protein
LDLFGGITYMPEGVSGETRSANLKERSFGKDNTVAFKSMSGQKTGHLNDGTFGKFVSLDGTDAGAYGKEKGAETPSQNITVPFRYTSPSKKGYHFLLLFVNIHYYYYLLLLL